MTPLVLYESPIKQILMDFQCRIFTTYSLTVFLSLHRLSYAIPLLQFVNCKLARAVPKATRLLGKIPTNLQHLAQTLHSR